MESAQDHVRIRLRAREKRERGVSKFPSPSLSNACHADYQRVGLAIWLGTALKDQI